MAAIGYTVQDRAVEPWDAHRARPLCTAEAADDRFNTTCKCGAPAYEGFDKVECSAPACPSYVRPPPPPVSPSDRETLPPEEPSFDEAPDWVVDFQTLDKWVTGQDASLKGFSAYYFHTLTRSLTLKRSLELVLIHLREGCREDLETAVQIANSRGWTL